MMRFLTLNRVITWTAVALLLVLGAAATAQYGHPTGDVQIESQASEIVLPDAAWDTPESFSPAEIGGYIAGIWKSIWDVDSIPSARALAVVLFGGFVVFNIIGIGVTIAILFWLFGRLQRNANAATA